MASAARVYGLFKTFIYRQAGFQRRCTINVECSTELRLQSDSLAIFKSRLKTALFTTAFDSYDVM